MKTLTLLVVWALLLSSCKYAPEFLKSRQKAVEGPSITGSYHLLIYKGIDPTGRIHYPYDIEVKGFALFDNEGNYSLQLYDANRPRLSNSDPFFCSDAEIRIAFLSELSSYGNYQVQGDSIYFQPEAAHLQNLTGKTVKKYFEMHGDTLLMNAPGHRFNGVFLAEQSVWVR